MELSSPINPNATDAFCLDNLLLSNQDDPQNELELVKDYLNTSYNVLALIAYFEDKSSFKTLYKYNRLSLNNLRYFKLNCCIFNEKYKQKKKSNKITIRSYAQGRNVKVFDFIRFLNNYMATYQLSKLNVDNSNKNVFNGSFISKDDLANNESDIDFLVEKADELAGCYGFKNAEEFFHDKILSERNCVELIMSNE